eukprot:TRINITY_DN2074_c0_g6_i1.p1 TRINITY_DN2074_c0_g6~~TRINITY_DN2074_c0_g6_i1.p1  ORF type:complete len:368 (-),score=73.87 TRINITY_DN2074_c0_g6_i1:56-1015(-)
MEVEEQVQEVFDKLEVSSSELDMDEWICEYLVDPESRECRREISKRVARELVFWGGDFLNNSEFNTSLIVHRCALVLERLSFLPRYTKGGAMIRPKYYEGNRTSIVHFPRLTHLSIPFHTYVENPFEWGYDAPSLKHIELLIDPEHVSISESAYYFHDYIQVWQRPDKVPTALLAHYPELRDITAVIARVDDKTRTRIPWAILHTPRRESWDVVRLLFIAFHKEQLDERSENQVGREGEVKGEVIDGELTTARAAKEMKCLLSILPLEVIHKIVDYLWRGWRVERLPFLDAKQREELVPHINDSFFFPLPLQPPIHISW